jgi:hypothetical protein
MRVVTLGSLGAVAPVVPAGAPQYYGIGDTTAADTMAGMDPKKTFGIGLVLGTLVGAVGMHLYMKR